MSLSAGKASANELVFGVGAAGVLRDSNFLSANFVLEYHSTPFFEGFGATYSWLSTFEYDADNDRFIGAGIHANWNFGNTRFSGQISFAPGYYRQGRFGKDLGSSIQFRSLAGLGFALTQRDKLSVSFDHKSNAGIERPNPGTETVVLRYTRRF